MFTLTIAAIAAPGPVMAAEVVTLKSAKAVSDGSLTIMFNTSGGMVDGAT